MLKLLSWIVLFVICSGCTTATHFTIPKGSTLFIEEQKVPAAELGKFARKPFFWSSVSGIPYRIEVDGRVVDQGKIRAKFRVVAVFFPPAALIYWPMGFDGRGYDFTDPRSFTGAAANIKRKGSMRE